MRHPLLYTFMGFHLNALVDQGEHLDYGETTLFIDNRRVIPWLHEKFPGELDLSLFSPDELDRAERYFESMANAVDAERKFGVKKNGLCLLIAYCLEAAQREEKQLY
ncbi:hypothetical protein [Flaviaesturariibacter amylovorans]|uniref:Uncharacterized protein n=1 Tax=Flaviaesturariibacter amylovorans TaxID=1084520 RepID=A0ABP8H4K4_9BACT